MSDQGVFCEPVPNDNPVRPPASDLARFDFQCEYRLAPDGEVSRRYQFQLPTSARNGETALYCFEPRAADLLAFTDVTPERRARISAVVSGVIVEFEELAARYIGTLRGLGTMDGDLALGYVGIIDLRDYYDFNTAAIMLLGPEADLNDNSSWERYYFVQNDGSVNLDNNPRARKEMPTTWRLAHEELDRYNDDIVEFLTQTKAAYEALRAELRAN